MSKQNIEKLFDGKGGYVFISHSHKDIRIVREIRNLFEENGFEPILFYLKCMDQDLTENTALLRDLIYREIDARELFLYVNSDNAKASKWVQEELLYAKKDTNKRIETIDIDEILKNKNANDKLIFDIKNKVNNIIKSSKVYMIYSNKDEEVFVDIQEFLLKKDYRVFNPKFDLLNGMNYAEMLATKVKEAAENGIIIYIIGKKSIDSPYCKAELEFARKYNSKIIFTVLDNMNTETINRDGFDRVSIIKYEKNDDFYKKLSGEILKMKY